MSIYTVYNMVYGTVPFPDGGGRSLAKASTGRLWAVFADNPAGYTNDQIYCAYSDDGGATWIVEQVTFDDTARHRYPCIAIDSADGVHIVYNRLVLGDDVLFYMRRNGRWDPEEIVSQVAGANQSDGVIAIDSSDNIHVCWWGEGEGTFPAFRQVKYRRRPPAGWEAMELITDINSIQWLPSIAIDFSNNVHVVWYGTGLGTFPARRNIIYRMRTAAWQPPELITDVNQDQFIPQIAIDSINVPHVVWQAPGDIHYSNRAAGAWSAPLAIGEDPLNHNQDNPSIAIDSSDNVQVAWVSSRLLPATPYNVRYRKREAGVWQPQVEITAEGVHDQYYTDLLWAMHPIVYGDRTNVPTSAPYLIWFDDEGAGILKFYTVISAAIPFRINRAYALSREEL